MNYNYLQHEKSTENNSEQEKPDIKECILINSNYIKFKNWQN